MSDTSPVERFATALRDFEESGDSAALVDCFAEDPELLRPEASRGRTSASDAAAFWDSYRAQFDEIRTEFHHTEDGADHAWLEWESRGKLSTGRDINYHGVSLLSFGDGGKVQRFATYYDTAAFLEPTG